MAASRVEISLSEEQTEALDAARGFEPRASFVKRALESALNSDGVAGSSAVVRSRSGGDEQAPSANASREVPSASSRAPVEKESPPHAAARQASRGMGDSGATGQSGAAPAVSKATGVRSAAPSRPAFSCPTPGCDFTAPSPAAKCSVHGRTVR